MTNIMPVKISQKNKLRRKLCCVCVWVAMCVFESLINCKKKFLKEIFEDSISNQWWFPGGFVG